MDIAMDISEGLARNVLSASVNGEVWDAARAKELGLIDGIGIMEEILEAKFGEDIKLKYINKKKSFLSRFSSSLINEINTKIVEKYYFSKFGL